MKRHFLTLVLLIYSGTLLSQSEDTTYIKPTGQTFHVYKDAAFAIAPALRYATPEGASMAGSLKMRMFLGKRFSFDSEIAIGKDYLTFGPGLIGIPCWLLLFPSLDEDVSLEQMAGIAILAALTAEHTAYHIPLKKYTDLSPYISLLKFRTFYKNYKADAPAGSEDQVCFGVGLELNKYFNKMVLSPYIEYNQGYGDPHGFMYTGVYLGFYIFN